MNGQPAYSIIRKLGGTTAVARYLNLHLSAVEYWYTRDRKYWNRNKQHNGLIPSKHIPALCRLGKNKGIKLEPNNFFRGHMSK